MFCKMFSPILPPLGDLNAPLLPLMDLMKPLRTIIHQCPALDEQMGCHF